MGLKPERTSLCLTKTWQFSNLLDTGALFLEVELNMQTVMMTDIACVALQWPDNLAAVQDHHHSQAWVHVPHPRA